MQHAEDVRSDGPAEGSGPELIDRAADGGKLEPTEANAALDWMLSDDPEDAVETRTLELNVGSAANPKWIPWTIGPVEEGIILRILREANPTQPSNRASRRRNAPQEDANLRIVVAATIDPDLREVARARGIADPSTALRMSFQKKPGLIGQIADAVMGLSGFDDEDVRDAKEVRAGEA